MTDDVADSTRVNVLGVRVSATSPAEATKTIRRWVEAGAREYVCVTPVSGVMAAQRDPRVLRALNNAGMVVPDGMPIVWAGRHAGSDEIDRVYGPDLMESIWSMAAESGWDTFIYGGDNGVAERVARSLCERIGEAPIVGTHMPPFRPLTTEERRDVIDEINQSGAKIVWVGLSTPKQDLWMADVVDQLDGPVVLLGVGAAFDIHAGIKKRPPSWLGSLGLFWLYRLLQEPSRLWRRYLVDNPGFVARILRDRPFLESK